MSSQQSSIAETDELRHDVREQRHRIDCGGVLAVVTGARRATTVSHCVARKLRGVMSAQYLYLHFMIFLMRQNTLPIALAMSFLSRPNSQ